MEHVDLLAFDTDGAIEETAAKAGIDRKSFFRRAGVAGAGLVAGGSILGAFTGSALAADTPQSDIDILNFALTLEYLEAEYYRQGSASGALSGNWQRTAVLLAQDETAHVQALQQALGSAAVASPKFDFKGLPNDPGGFIKTAYVLESTGVHAYLGQAGNLKTPALLAAAASIVTVEAAHRAAIAMLAQQDDPRGKNGINPDGPFDTPLTKDQVLAAVTQTGFIVG
jgi:hypothetical protein